MVEAEPEKLFCPFCDYQCGTKINLKNHISTTHLQPEGSINNEVQPPEIASDVDHDTDFSDIFPGGITAEDVDEILLVDATEMDHPETMEESSGIEGRSAEDEAGVDVEEETIKNKYGKGDVLMVKRKTLWWPATFIGQEGSEMSVMILNKKKTMILVEENLLKLDHSQMQGMKRDWKDAYLSAANMTKK